MGDRPTTGAAVSRSAARMPGTPRMVPTETTGLDGGRITRSAPVIASRTPGAGVDWSRPTNDQLLGRDLGVQAHPVLLEVHDALAAGLGGSAIATWVSTRSSVIGSRRSRPRTGCAPPSAQRLRDLGEGVAGLQHLAADQVGRDVAVAQPEPRRLDAVRLQVLLGVEGLVAATPPALEVDALAEGVHHGVEVGADLEPVDPQVVGRVGDDGDLGADATPGRVRCSMPCSRPWRNRAPPMPPERTVIFCMGEACPTAHHPIVAAHGPFGPYQIRA